MNKSEQNIPQGYKQTVVGVIPEDWEVRRIFEIGEINVGRDVKKEIFSKNFTNKFLYPVYSNTVDNYGLYGFYSEYEYPENTLTVVGRGVGIGTAFHRSKPYGAIGRLLVLKPYENNNIFLTEIINHRLRIFAESAAIPQLTGVQFGKYKLPIPPLPEQEKIADCLTTWDRSIEKLTALINAKKQAKKGLMQQLLTGKKRLPGFTDEWKEVKFEELFQRIPSKTYQLQTKDYDFNGKYPIIDQGQKEIIGYSDINKKVFSNVPIIVFGDHTRIFKYINFKFIIGADGVQLLKNKSEDNILFLYYLLSNTPIPNLGYSRHMRILKGKTFYIPSRKEQTAIAEILQTADMEIDLLEEKLKAIEQQKKGLMQLLLTGKKRLV